MNETGPGRVWNRIRSAALPALLLGLASGAVFGAEAKVDFNRDIRPILTEKCFACHGPDAKQVKGNLRVDLRTSALQAHDDGSIAIVPGKPDESDLVFRIESDDELSVMPPPKARKQLSAAEKELLRRWVAEGANYETHWAFNPPVRPQPPAVKQKDWPRNPIDRFILARLEQEGLPPSPEADRTTLIRRVSLDLTGLPPTPAEVEAFVKDSAPDAYEKLVDRLLASPHFGERMALWWLDGARYADSNGYQADFERFMWRWRDWVIDAFNANKPFDQFTVEQLAGDLLPNPTIEQRIATGFNRNHRINTEGGIIAEEWRVETVIDRVETTSAVWMGLTMGCCRCHDHKFDPIKQKEFYQFFSFFNNVAESGVGEERPVNHPPIMKAPRTWEQQQLRELDEAIEKAEKAVADKEPFLSMLQASWEKETLPRLIAQRLDWPLLEPAELASQGGATLKRLEDGSILASGQNPPKDIYTITVKAAPTPITSIRLEILPHGSLPQGSFGRHTNGNFVLSGFEAEVAGPKGVAPVKAKLARALADYSQKDWSIENVLLGRDDKGWAADGFMPDKRVERQALFVPEDPIAVQPGGTLTIRLRFQALDQHNLGRFRLTATSQNNPSLPERIVPSSIAAALFTDPYKRTAQQKTELAEYVRANHAGPLTEAVRAVAQARQARSEFEKTIPTVMVLAELDRPRDCYVLVRGLYDKHGEKVTAGLPRVLPPMPAGQPMNRLGLARWLVDPGHPLTARVQVNRFWELLFGTGIVKSSENFGVQAEWPSHPELLDWLATEFIGRKWNVKAMLKEIVTSATYRQASDVSSSELERDPENRLLARGPRFRLQAELVRDQALAISGLLVPKIGGPSVRPYMPEGIWDEINVYGNLRNYKPDQGEGLYRRSMYTIWKRTAAPPSMMLFDAPSREICTVKRARTNTPLQALALLNEETYVEAARVLAQRMIKEGGTSAAERIAYGFRCATARRPNPNELKILADGLARRLSEYRSHPEQAKKLVQVGSSRPDPKTDPIELAAYTMTASVILNLDETITKE